MRKGLYRLVLNDFGDCARTSDSAGDAAPFLDRATYERLNFEPPFDALPSKSEYVQAGRLPYPTRLRCEEIWSAKL